MSPFKGEKKKMMRDLISMFPFVEEGLLVRKKKKRGKERRRRRRKKGKEEERKKKRKKKGYILRIEGLC
ncbi:hypothetical protein E1A91_D10G152500v1 [Gossypium mustelinum]|uniref:Uncharacterized protein n=1 Tax=Gossypium mustelinum TaxID=34275 RepID=A0A5D2TAH3_GOSMU|nr:hypothetical protein E1A91_D10G152500v1 [Gossypium mustelinum]